MRKPSDAAGSSAFSAMSSCAVRSHSAVHCWRNDAACAVGRRNLAFDGAAPCRQPLARDAVELSRKPLQPTLHILQRRRRRAARDRHGRTGRIEKAHAFVRQLPCGNIPRGQTHRRLQRRLGDRDAVMLLQHRHQPAHHRHRDIVLRLVDLHGLETPGQRRIALEILLVFRPGGGCDRAQLAARQLGLYQIGRIALPGRPTRADQRVRLVDEQDDRHRRRLDVGNHALQPRLELTARARPRLQQAEIERAHRDAAQSRRHVAGGHAQREPLDDGGFADARLAHQYRIVLPAARQDIDHLAYLAVAPDDRVDLAGARLRGEVDRVGLERAALLARHGPAQRARLRCPARLLRSPAGGGGLQPLRVNVAELLRKIVRHGAQCRVAHQRAQQVELADSHAAALQ